MIINYNSLSSGRDTWLKNDVGDVVGSPPQSSKVTRRSWLVVCMLFLSLVIGQQTWAQSSANYAFSTNNNGSLALDMNGNAINMATGTTQLVAPGLDAAVSPVTSIGFDFYLMGTKFTQFSVQEDGILQLGPNVVPTNTYTIAGGTASAPRLAAFGCDMRTGTTTGKIHYKLSGIAPNRVLVVEFVDMQLFYTGSAAAGTSTFQMRFYETTSAVEYVYGTMSATVVSGTTDRSPHVGFYVGSATGSFASVSYATQTNSTTSPYAPNAAIAAIGAVTNLTSAADGSRRFYRFVPPSTPPADPTSLTFTAIAGNAMTPNWVDNSTNETGFVVTRATDAAFTLNVVTGSVASTTSAGTGNTYVLAQTGLTPSTTYFYKVQALNEGSASAGLTGSQITNAPATITSVASGNWSTPATWAGGAVPASFDNAIIADGHNVTIDVTGLSITNLTVGGGVSGAILYGTTPSSFTVLGNLTVNAGATFSAYNGTTGKSLIVGGNLTNDGTIDLSVGTSTTNILTLNGTTVQTVGGSGSYVGGVIRNLTFNNTNAATPNINWNASNISIGGNLIFTAGKVALGAANKMTLGTGTATGTGAGAVGSLSYTAGGFTNGKFNRYWASTGAGSTVTAGTDASAVAGRYPFVSAAGQQRSAFIERTTALAAGQLSCTYADAATMSAVSIADGAYTVQSRYDGNWTFSVEGSGFSATTIEAFLFGTGAYVAANGNGRILLAGAPAGGSHQGGTTTPGVERLFDVAGLTAGPLYIGAASADIVQPCTGTPTPGTIAAGLATQNICGGSAPTALVATGFTTGATGIVFQWEESDDNGVTDAWANAVGGSGATTATYTAPVLSAARYYRLKVSCTGSGLFDYTNVATINIVVCTYDVTKSAEAFTSISGTGLSPTWRSASLITDDNLSNAVPIGWNFPYKGGTYGNVLLSTNGYLTFNTGTASTGGGLSAYGYDNTYFTNSSAGTYLSLAPFYEDLVCAGNPGTLAGLQASIKYQTTGSTPNRVFTAEWIGMETFGNAGPNLNFQVKLYEATGAIEYTYGTMEMFNGTLNFGYSYTVGLNGSTVGSTPTVAQLQTQQIDNVQNFSSVAKNNLDRLIDCNSKLTFTPGTYAGAATAPALLNDEPAGALTLNVNPSQCTSYCGTYYTTNGATASAGIPVCSAATAGTPDDDVWFKFTTGAAVADYTVKLLGAGGFNSVVQLFSDAGVTSVACVNATADGLIESLSATALAANTTYYVRVYHSGTGTNTAGAGTGNTTSGGAPDFSICVSVTNLPPVNDNPCGAITLTPSNSCVPYSDTSASSTTSLTSATTTTSNGVGAPDCSGAGASVTDVWFKMTATSTTHGLTVTPVPGFDVALQAFAITSGTCGTSDLVLTPIGCVNGGSTGVVEQVVFTTVIGQEYYLRVYRHPAGIAGTPVSNSQFSICVYNPLPTCTTNVSPANLATNVSITPTLTWNQVAYATAYDVYLGTTSGPTTLIGSTVGATSLSYTLTAAQTLNGLTQYFWYVVPKNLNGTAVCGAANETSFTTQNGCLTPTGLTTPALGATTATVAWTASTSAPANGYEYEVRLSGAAGSGSTGLQASGATVAGDTNDNVTGLISATTYSLYVRSICSPTSTGDWTAAYVFTTACDAITTLPHSEGFEGTGIPACWSTDVNGGTTNWAVITSNDGVPTPRTGTQLAGKNWNSSTNDDSLLFSPLYNFTATPTQARVNVWIYRNTVNGLATDRVAFYANSAHSLTGAATLIDIPLAASAAPVVATSGWYNYIANIPTSIIAAGNFYIIAKGSTTTSFSSYGVGFDDYSIEARPVGIDSFTPAATCATSGDTIVITGYAFTGTTAVKFNGIDAASFTVDSNTQISAVIPSGLTTGVITVYAPTGTATSDTSLTINPNPTVAEIQSPAGETYICMPDTLTLTNSTGTGVWSSSDDDVATVSGGVVTPHTEGSVIIYYTVTNIVTGCSTAKSYALNVNNPVAIVSSTPTQTIVTGGNTFFAVVATGTGTPNLTYSWEVCTDGSGVNFDPVTDGGVYSGATTGTLNLTNVPDTYYGYLYQCTVTGVCNSVITDLAVLLVGETGIDPQPSDATICDAGAGSASFTVGGSPDVTAYQWYEDQGGDNFLPITNGGIYAGADTATLSLTGLTLANSGWRYLCVVTGVGTAASNPATLTVVQSVTVNTPPTAQSVCYTGGTANFTVGASGGIASYQWQYSSTPLVEGSWVNVVPGTPTGATGYSGALTASLNVTTSAALSAVTSHNYRAIVNGNAPCGSVPSASAVLNVTTPAIVVTPPSATYCNPGTGVTLTASGATTYSWTPATGLSATTGASVVANPTTTTTYTVTGTIGGCSNTKTVTVTVTPATSATATAAKLTACPGESIQLTATGAQVFTTGAISGYTFAATTGTFTQVSGAATPVTAVQQDDAISGALGIGFTFNYGGTNYTQFKMSSNGFMTLNTGASDTATNNLSSVAAAARPIIAPLWDDLDGSATGGSTASYEVTGSAPNRVLTVEWRNYEWNYQSTTPVISFQAKLYESTNLIEFAYRSETGAYSAGTTGGASIGISSPTASGSGNYLSLSSVAAPAVSSTTSTNSLTTKPATGTVYRFTPSGAPTFTYAWTSVPAGFTSSIANPTVNPTVNTTYNVVVSGGGCDGNASVTINTVSGAAITSQPVLQTVCQGFPASFSVTATGPSLTYQWRRNGTPVALATASTLNIVATTLADAGSYDVVITPLCGSPVTSDAVALTVNALPVIVTQPAAPAAVCATAGTATISVNATGTATYQWRRNGVNLSNVAPFSGTTSATLTITNPAESDAGTFDVVLTSSASCTTTSNGVSLNVNPAPAVTTSATICQGGSATLTATVNCTGFVNSGTTISGAWTAATDPVALRPATSITDTATCGFDAAITRNYVATPFQVTTTGAYTLEMNDNSAYDGMAYITTGAFVPGNCSGGGTWVKGDDDSGVIDNEPKITATLTAGVTYTLVSTTWSTTSGTVSGAFTWTVTPPAGGQVKLFGTGNVEWYTASTGGTAIATGTPFNPVGVAGSGLANTNTAGTTTYYAACSNNNTCRTAATFTINANVTYYADADFDGYGNPAVSVTNCTGQPAGYVTNNTDCNDAVGAINPGHAEVLYNGVDDNCDGNLDEGNLLTTSLLSSDCNSTLAAIGSLVGIQTIAPAATITGWRVRATNGAQVQVIEINVPHFTMQQFPSYAYATTYTIDIQLQRNGVWLGYYGPTCQISTPAILSEGGAAQVSPSQCGITLPKINTLIATTSLAGVTGYRFRVTNLTDPLGPNAVQTIDRTQNWFSLQMLTRYNYGTTYRIEVSVKSGTGAFGGFGSPCEVSSPPAPALVNCGGVVATGTTNVVATSLPGATQYRFQITRVSDNASSTIDRNANFFTFNAVPAATFAPGVLFAVRVAVMTTGTWSPFGDACEITSPGTAARFTPTAPTASSEFKATAYPNPFASEFAIDVTTSSDENVQVKVYDMLGKLIESREVKVSELNTEKAGQQYPSGVYNVIVSQGGIVKTLRVIKR